MLKIKTYFNGLLLLGALLLAVSFVAPTHCLQVGAAGNEQVRVVATNEETENVEEAEETLLMPNLNNLGPVVSNDQDGINNAYFYQYLLEVFNSTYKNYEGFVAQTQLRVNTLSEIKEIALVDLKLKDISGIQHLNLAKLEVLDLSLNEISEFSVNDLKYLDNLKELNLYHNNISQFEIPARLGKLQKLNLNANNLSQIDISKINIGEVYLSLNKFTSVKNVKLPTITSTTNLYVELLNNNILDGDELYLNNGLTNLGGQINVELGLQGVGLNQKVTVDEDDVVTPKIPRNNGIKFYNINKYDVKVQIINYDNNEVVKTVENSEENPITKFELAVGHYKINYVNPQTNATLFNYLDSNYGAFKGNGKFTMLPKSPDVKFLVKGKEYDDYKKFTSWDAKIVGHNLDDGGKLYYSIADSKWTEGNEVKLNRGGQYIVAFKCVYENGIESEVVTKQVYMSLNPYIPDFAMLLIIGVVVLLLFFIALPLIKKFVIKR